MKKRQWSILLNGAPFVAATNGPQLRVVFDIVAKPGDTLSFADIRLYNLSKDTTIGRGDSIVFSAGFEDLLDSIFIGYITNILKERDGPNVVTRLLCRSGTPVDDRGSAQGSYGPGAKIVDVLRDLAQSWPRQLDIDPKQFEDSPTFTSGYVTDGDIPTILNKLAYEFDFDWIQERGRLVVVRKNRPRTTAIVQINQFEGMIGIPEVTRGPDGLGVFVVSKLNPYIRANTRINVRSEYSTFNTGNLFIQELSGDASANGEYNVFAVGYKGDSHGNRWTVEIDGLRALSAPTVAPSGTEPTNGALIWGKRVDQAFRVKVREICSRLGFDPNWLMAVMAFETGRSFDPGKKNPGSSATGLIQFVESTARGLGTTTIQLARMTAVEQLDYVEKYFQPYKRRINNLGDCYMAVLWPIGIGQPDSYVMWQRDTGPYQREYNANAGLDVDRDGKITRGEAVSRVNAEMQRGQQFIR